jgi:hypothetical protein
LGRGPGGAQYLTKPQLLLNLGALKSIPGNVYLGPERRYQSNLAGIKSHDEFILQANMMSDLQALQPKSPASFRQPGSEVQKMNCGVQGRGRDT